MPLKSFLIGPQKEGWVNNVEPFFLPEEAFFDLEDVYLWRGRVKKRFGTSIIGNTEIESRLRAVFSTQTDGSGDFTDTAPGAIFKIGQSFSVGTDIFTVTQEGITATITNITQANPGEVTTSAAHGLSTSDVVFITDVVGMTEVNNLFFTITVTGASTFTLGVDTSAFTAYTSGGTVGEALAMLSTGSGTGIFATTNGGVQISGASATTDVYFYPVEPVMGERTRELLSINQEETLFFDTQFAYQLLNGAFERMTGEATPGSSVWTGDNADLFWSINYVAADPFSTNFYVVNYNAPDHIRFLEVGSSTWNDFQPRLDGGVGIPRTLDTCRILIGFKGRLIALNTKETDNSVSHTYVNRARFSKVGNPVDASATDTGSWNDVTPGRGGFLDATTKEAIISAKILKNRLIVYFERSPWELIGTTEDSNPFIWQKLNSELGCESTFSIIGFDKSVMGVGNVGVHTCNGVNVSRIDSKIPNEVFKIHNGNDGPRRVYGIRDYFNELVYWTFPSPETVSGNPVSELTFPNRILLYNYRNQTWSIINDTFTCFGYFQPPQQVTWDDLDRLYGDWNGWNTPWDYPFYQSSDLNIIAGNQQGFVLNIDSDRSSNGVGYYITNMNTALQQLTVIDHNLCTGDFLYIQDAQGITLTLDAQNQPITAFKVVYIDPDTIEIDKTVKKDPDDPNPFGWTGTYTGGGYLGRISNLNILSKEFNPGTPIGQQFRLPYADFLLSKASSTETDNQDVVIPGGAVSIEWLLDTADGTSVNDIAEPDVILGSNVLLTQPEDGQSLSEIAQQLWHRTYVSSQSSFIQFRIFMSDEQMLTPSIAQNIFEMHAILLYVEPQGRITG